MATEEGRRDTARTIEASERAAVAQCNAVQSLRFAERALRAAAQAHDRAACKYQQYAQGRSIAVDDYRRKAVFHQDHAEQDRRSAAEVHDRIADIERRTGTAAD